jgi:ribokinase
LYVAGSSPSGVALITVDATGENTIVVAAGANGSLERSDIDNAEQAITNADVIVLQLEIPLSTVEHTCTIAHEKGKRVLLNPAPAQALPDELLRKIFLLTPNITEAEILTGIHVTSEASAAEAALQLRSKGVQNVVITMGAHGAYISSDTFTGLIRAQKVKAVDSTAAGDIFTGALAVGMSEGKDLKGAVLLATKAAAISVTRMGAQASAPFKNELESQ